jgi:hypothetical protein
VKVLDSDTCIGILRGHTEVLERSARELDELTTTWVTASELFYGAAKSTKPEANAALVVRFLHTLPVLTPDLASARLFGEAGCGPDRGVGRRSRSALCRCTPVIRSGSGGYALRSPCTPAPASARSARCPLKGPRRARRTSPS